MDLEDVNNVEMEDNQIEIKENNDEIISFLQDNVDVHLLTTQSFCIAMKKFLGKTNIKK